jgi:hypothetical protein
MCTGTENLIKRIEQRFENDNIDNITYKEWKTTDRSTPETTVQSCTHFLKSFAEKLNILFLYSFIAWHQSYFYTELKLKFKTGEIAIIWDFSENYSFSIQDEVQGSHWNNA